MRRAVNLSRKSPCDFSKETLTSSSTGAGGVDTFRASTEALAFDILALKSAGGFEEAGASCESRFRWSENHAPSDAGWK